MRLYMFQRRIARVAAVASSARRRAAGSLKSNTGSSSLLLLGPACGVNSEGRGVCMITELERVRWGALGVPWGAGVWVCVWGGGGCNMLQ